MASNQFFGVAERPKSLLLQPDLSPLQRLFQFDDQILNIFQTESERHEVVHEVDGFAVCHRISKIDITDILAALRKLLGVCSARRESRPTNHTALST